MREYTLGPEALRQISALVRMEARKAVRTARAPAAKASPTLAVYLAESPAGGIPAMSGSTPGSAECLVKYIDDDGDIQAALDDQDDPIEVTVYNCSSSAVAGTTIVHCKQEIVSGKLLCDFEDCG